MHLEPFSMYKFTATSTQIGDPVMWKSPTAGGCGYPRQQTLAARDLKPKRLVTSLPSTTEPVFKNSPITTRRAHLVHMVYLLTNNYDRQRSTANNAAIISQFGSQSTHLQRVNLMPTRGSLIGRHSNRRGF